MRRNAKTVGQPIWPVKAVYGADPVKMPLRNSVGHNYPVNATYLPSSMPRDNPVYNVPSLLRFNDSRENRPGRFGLTDLCLVHTFAQLLYRQKAIQWNHLYGSHAWF